MTRQEARRETLIARELARVRGAEKTIGEIVAEVLGASSTPTETVEWHDASFNAWGAPTPRQVVAKAWGGGNCLKGCIASILGAAINRVPDPSDWSKGWLGRYNDRLAKSTGYRLDKLPPTVCPPKNPNQLWIATIREDGDADHCVVCRGYFIVHDPAGIYRGNVPMDRLVDGLIIVPARRVVPVFSLNGRHGSVAIPA